MGERRGRSGGGGAEFTIFWSFYIENILDASVPYYNSLNNFIIFIVYH